MIIEPIENTESTEFAQICMKWLNSNEPTLTVKDRKGNREKNVTYFRITLKGLDYRNVYLPFSEKGDGEDNLAK